MKINKFKISTYSLLSKKVSYEYLKLLAEDRTQDLKKHLLGKSIISDDQSSIKV